MLLAELEPRAATLEHPIGAQLAAIAQGVVDVVLEPHASADVEGPG